MKKINSCNWCNSKNISIIDKPISKYKNNIYYYYFCNNCEIKFAYCKKKLVKIDYDKIQNNHFGYNRHIADNKWVKSMFDINDTNYSVNEIYNFLATKTMDQRYLRAMEIANDAFKNKKKLDILEVGCNLGYVGALFIKQNHNYIGIDVQKDAIHLARKNYGKKYFHQIPFEKINKKLKKKFDLICSFEVIEHLKNPDSFFNFSINNLKKNGELVLSTPNGNFIPKDQWYSELPPIHYSLFKEKTFNILKRKNFEVKFYNKYQFSYNIFFLRKIFIFQILNLKKLLKNNKKNKYLIPITDPNNKNFIYSYKKTKLNFLRNFSFIRFISLINLFFSFLLSFLNSAPLAGQIFVGIKKKN